MTCIDTGKQIKDFQFNVSVRFVNFEDKKIITVAHIHYASFKL